MNEEFTTIANLRESIKHILNKAKTLKLSPDISKKIEVASTWIETMCTFFFEQTDYSEPLPLGDDNDLDLAIMMAVSAFSQKEEKYFPTTTTKMSELGVYF